MRKVAIVTGVGKGIGKAIAARLLQEDYTVAGVDVDQESGSLLQKEFGNERFYFIKADICQEKEVQALFRQVKETYGRLDGLVNNAGIIRDNLIWNMSLEDFDQVLNVNLRGTWLMCREAAMLMREQKSGRIVNIASRAWLGNKGQSNYSASKAGVVALSRVLALEMGPYNVSVNTVAPGLIDTPLTQKLKPEVREKLMAAQPGRAMGKADDVANAVAFLLSAATEFITGQTLYVDGGKSVGAGI